MLVSVSQFEMRSWKWLLCVDLLVSQEATSACNRPRNSVVCSGTREEKIGGFVTSLTCWKLWGNYEYDVNFLRHVHCSVQFGSMLWLSMKRLSLRFFCRISFQTIGVYRIKQATATATVRCAHIYIDLMAVLVQIEPFVTHTKHTCQNANCYVSMQNVVIF